MTEFSLDFISALNHWQKGWCEVQETKARLADDLERECAKIDGKYKIVNQPCYRKRYLHRGELIDVLYNGNKDEGITSWTTDYKYAEIFKGIYRDDAVTAAIFEYTPTPTEVILNINKLWECEDFKNQINTLSVEKPELCDAILNFQSNQSEVILKTPLRGNDIIALSGKSSDFDDLCDAANIPMEQRPAFFHQLCKDGYAIEMPTLIDRDATKNAIKNTLIKFNQLLTAVRNGSYRPA